MKSLKTKKKKSIGLKITQIIGIVFLNVLFLFSWYSKNVTPKLIHLSQRSIEKYIEHTASNFKIFTLEKNSSDKFLKITENQNGEIAGIDYDMIKIYDLADKLTNNIEENMMNSEILNKYLNKKENISSVEDGLIIWIPLGVVSDSIFLANLGPKIPILVKFLGSVFSSVKTRVTDYGINNVLLEVYLDVTITYEIVTPITLDEKKIKFELLLDSKVIQGKVPNLYGGILENRSAFFEVPFS